MNIQPGKVWGLRRMADSNGLFKMTAVDQRPPIKNPIKEKLGTDKAPWQDVAGFKKLLIEILQTESSAMLLDPHYAYPAGISVYSPTKGLIITLEDSLFEENNGERLSREIDSWSVDKIKRIGGDAVKVLVWYRPDTDIATRKQQEDFVERIGEECNKFDIPFLLELLVYPLPGDADTSQLKSDLDNKKADFVLESVSTFAKPDFYVDVLKLESPVSPKLLTSNEDSARQDVQKLFNEMGKIANRPWVMLSAGATKDEFFKILTHAYEAGASGYLAGRAIWNDAFQNFPDWVKIEDQLRSESLPYMQKLNELTDAKATPWHEHEAVATRKEVTPFDTNYREYYLETDVSIQSLTKAISHFQDSGKKFVNDRQFNWCYPVSKRQ